MMRARRFGRKVPIIKNLLEENSNLRTDKGVLQLEKGQLEADIRERDSKINEPRNFLAHHYIRGSGIEIGAAHYPVKMPRRAKVKYVDVFSSEDLRKIFPQDYATTDIVNVDVVDDGETLTKFKNDSLDFIIANHFLEHCLDPIGTVLNMYTKLRKRGVLFMAIPDKRYTFDKLRPVTDYAHLLEEHQDKTKQKFRKSHTVEAIQLTTKLKSKKSIDARVKEILDSGFRIHYHVWTQKEITDFFVRLAADFKIDLEIEAILKNRHEVIYVLKKEPPLRLQSL